MYDNVLIALVLHDNLAKKLLEFSYCSNARNYCKTKPPTRFSKRRNNIPSILPNKLEVTTRNLQCFNFWSRRIETASTTITIFSNSVFQEAIGYICLWFFMLLHLAKHSFLYHHLVAGWPFLVEVDQYMKCNTQST